MKKTVKLTLNKEGIKLLSVRDLGTIAGGSAGTTDTCDFFYPTKRCYSGGGVSQLNNCDEIQ